MLRPPLLNGLQRVLLPRTTASLPLPPSPPPPPSRKLRRMLPDHRLQMATDARAEEMAGRGPVPVLGAALPLLLLLVLPRRCGGAA